MAKDRLTTVQLGNAAKIRGEHDRIERLINEVSNAKRKAFSVTLTFPSLSSNTFGNLQVSKAALLKVLRDRLATCDSALKSMGL